MGRSFAFFVLVLVTMHASHARTVPGDVGLVTQQTMMSDSAKEQMLEANAPKADSPKGNAIDDKKNFIYGGVGGFAGMGAYAGMVGGLPLVGGLGGIGKYGGIGGAAGIGGYHGIGGLGGLGGAGGLGGTGGLGGGAGDAGGGATGGGILPPP
ncbi:hypothetical protein Gogos_003401 [Gossypium gossypioides]|uniref:Glycine-rich protein n=1 Tax=Gossypium gossypioides TaxID=34282 RepID=A0A7J9CLY4_GOSGO|nr:hypothetical protein [Gossypium gossypioides]